MGRTLVEAQLPPDAFLLVFPTTTPFLSSMFEQKGDL